MDAKCPHCGSVYEVEKNEIGSQVCCQICGNDFVIKQCAILNRGASRSGSRRMAMVQRRMINEESQTKERASFVKALVIVGIIVAISISLFPFIKSAAESSAHGASLSNSVVIDGIVIDKLEGCTFEKSSILGRDLYTAKFPGYWDFVPNVTIFTDTVSDGALPSTLLYIAKSLEQFKAAGLNSKILADDGEVVSILSDGNGMFFAQKIFRDVRRNRFIVVTGTMKTDKYFRAEVSEKILKCVYSAKFK